MPQLTIRKFYPMCGRVRSAQTGSFILGVGLLLYGIAYLFSSPFYFTSLSMLGRLLQGVGSAIERTSFVAIIGHSFPEEKGKYLVVQLVSMMFGKASGPFISGEISTLLRYDTLFYLVAASNFLKLFLYSAFDSGPLDTLSPVCT